MGLHEVPTEIFVVKPLVKRIRKFACNSTQLAKGRKFHAYTVDSRSTCVDLRTNLSSIKVNTSRRKPTSGWPNETQVEYLRRLASPFGQVLRQILAKAINLRVSFSSLCEKIVHHSTGAVKVELEL